MNGLAMFLMMLWMPLAIVFSLAVLAVIVLLLARWLNTKQTPTVLSPPQPTIRQQPYEQGYQPPRPSPETYQEGGRQYLYPQPEYERPQAQYPQEQQMPRQR